jgi:hypothetical protein
MDDRTDYLAEVLRGATTVEQKRERLEEILEQEQKQKARSEAEANAPEPQDVRQPQLPHPVARKVARERADACALHIRWLEAELKTLLDK